MVGSKTDMEKQWPFEKLEVWKRAQDFADDIYQFSNTLPERETYGLGDQIRRAATSVVLNIAEGKGRDSDKEYTQFLYNARGSLYEVVTCLRIAKRQELLKQQRAQKLENRAYEIHKMLSGLIQSLK